MDFLDARPCGPLDGDVRRQPQREYAEAAYRRRVVWAILFTLYEGMRTLGAARRAHARIVAP